MTLAAIDHEHRPRPVRVEDAAHNAGVSVRTIRRWLASGVVRPLPNVLDRRVWLDMDDVYDARVRGVR